MASLRVKDQGQGPVVYGRWRDAGRNVERPIGRGWLVREGEAGAKPNGRMIGKWRERRGKPQEGFLSVQEAEQRLPMAQEAYRAEEARKEAQRRREQGEGITLAQAAERFLEWGEQDDPHEDRDGWKHSYAHNTRRYVGRIVRELGADRRIDAISASDLLVFMAGLVPSRNGKPTGVRPTRKFLSNYALPLKGLFAYAHRNGWIEEDVSMALPSYKPRAKRAADPLRREEYLTPEEARAVVGALVDEQDRAMILAMSMAGLRPGECISVRWQDVDFATSTLRIVESRTLGVTGVPKSGVGRSVPMPVEVARALAKVGQRDFLTGQDDLVFVGKALAHVDLDALRRRFHAAQDSVEISPRRDLRELRNTHGTALAAAGVPMRTIQEWMGHESIRTTERYASFMPRDQDAVKVSQAFEVGTVADAALAAQD